MPAHPRISGMLVAALIGVVALSSALPAEPTAPRPTLTQPRTGTITSGSDGSTSWSQPCGSGTLQADQPERKKPLRQTRVATQTLWAAILLSLSGQVATPEAVQQTLFAFTAADAAQQWQAVNDGVMGGVSDGRFKITPDKTMEFFGTLSLENNGGFASVRSKPRDLDFKAGDSIVVRVKGDGREYVLNLYTKSRRMAFSYRAPLPTTHGEWTALAVPLAEFIPTAFGRRVQGMGPVQPEDITALGFMLSDKKPGPFTLEVESVGVSRAER